MVVHGWLVALTVAVGAGWAVGALHAAWTSMWAFAVAAVAGVALAGAVVGALVSGASVQDGAQLGAAALAVWLQDAELTDADDGQLSALFNRRAAAGTLAGGYLEVGCAPGSGPVVASSCGLCDGV